MRAVIDTNVVFEGLTKRSGASSVILRFWSRQLFTPCVSLPLALEYEDVLARLLSSQRWVRVKPALRRLLDTAEQTQIYYRWRPSSPDPGDEFLIDCAMNARAAVVTKTRKDFRLAELNLGLRVMDPVEFVTHILEQHNGTI